MEITSLKSKTNFHDVCPNNQKRISYFDSVDTLYHIFTILLRNLAVRLKTAILKWGPEKKLKIAEL